MDRRFLLILVLAFLVLGGCVNNISGTDCGMDYYCMRQSIKNDCQPAFYHYQNPAFVNVVDIRIQRNGDYCEVNMISNVNGRIDGRYKAEIIMPAEKCGDEYGWKTANGNCARIYAVGNYPPTSELTDGFERY